MKLNPAQLTLACLLFAAPQAFAQEERTHTEWETNTSREVRGVDPIIPEVEGKSSKTVASPVIRDSVQIKPVLKPLNTKPQEKAKTDDPLQFNFLYYIIERFKLSDVIE
jgi:hypothetical protein